ncbi:MAG: mechanosensitive ion channel family protein [Flavobacteriales bacterium]|nr:mechanosensitive ion channel family protein [Flavobacteriales bacterium]HRH71310.1 mechanosensitive ion channel family protein [Flavobacteriales bacterium]
MPLTETFTDRVNIVMDKLGFNLLLLAKIVLVLVTAFIVERVLYLLLRRAYKRSEKGREDATRYKFLKNALRFIVGLAAFGTIISMIPSIKHLAVTLFAGAGILVAILGLATQRAFSNIISGIFIVSFKPFRVGDTIRIADKYSGIVEDITLRHTVLVTGENRRVIIPNSIISDEYIVNSSIADETVCEQVDVTITYTSDMEKAIALLQELSEAHPSCLDRRTAHEFDNGEHHVIVRVVSLTEQGVRLRALVWAKDPGTASVMHQELNRSIRTAFVREGIEFSYAYDRPFTPLPKDVSIDRPTAMP